MPEAHSISDLLTEHAQEIAAALPEYLQQQRWFGGKSRPIESASLEIILEVGTSGASLVRANIHYVDGSEDTYQLPLAARYHSNDLSAMVSPAKHIVCSITQGQKVVTIYDATTDEDFRSALLHMAEEDHSSKLSSRVVSAEQSNTSIIFGDQSILKIYRRLQAGENPDVEITRFLTVAAEFSHIPRYLGNISDQQGSTLAFLQAFVANQGDGWEWIQGQLKVLLGVLSAPGNDLSTKLRVAAVPSLEAASLLGKRTAELHLALATETENLAFAAEPFTPTDLAFESKRFRNQVAMTLDALQAHLKQLPKKSVETAARLLAKRRDLLDQADALATSSHYRMGYRIRIHGDYHLGQVLRIQNDFLMMDLEGEPARPLAERKRKQSPLRDVAGMLRSFSYAAASAVEACEPGQKEVAAQAAASWTAEASTRFIASYRDVVSEVPELIPHGEYFDFILSVFLLEKALYEMLYELNNRPSWLHIPLNGVLSLIAEVA